MFSKKGKAQAEKLVEKNGKLIAEIQDPRLVSRALAEGGNVGSLVAYGSWEEGIVTQWKNGTWTSGEPLKIEHVEDGDATMAQGNFEEYMRCLKKVDARRRV